MILIKVYSSQSSINFSFKINIKADEKDIIITTNIIIALFKLIKTKTHIQNSKSFWELSSKLHLLRLRYTND